MSPPTKPQYPSDTPQSIPRVIMPAYNPSSAPVDTLARLEHVQMIVHDQLVDRFLFVLGGRVPIDLHFDQKFLNRTHPKEILFEVRRVLAELIPEGFIVESSRMLDEIPSRPFI